METIDVEDAARLYRRIVRRSHPPLELKEKIINQYPHLGIFRFDYNGERVFLGVNKERFEYHVRTRKALYGSKVDSILPCEAYDPSRV